MTFLMRLPLILVLDALLVISQDPAPVFRGGTAQVRVDVQVEQGGKPIGGLTKDDFLVREVGVPQDIAYFGHEAEPVQVLLVLDISGSMSRILTDMAATGRHALAALRPDDEVGIMLFARQTEMTVEPTTDRALAGRLLREAPLTKELGSGTAINMALLEAASFLRKAPSFRGRRAIVILTDNGSLNYQASDEAVIRALSDTDTVLNAIVPAGLKAPPPQKFSAARNPDFTPSDVFHLTRETGGEVLRADKAGERFREMLERIRLRYNLAFRPSPGPPGSYRHIEVELSPAARKRYPKAEVRARSGYFTPAVE
jgi:VWFA-related protein